MDYADSKTVQDTLADGHSLEALFMYDADTRASSEVKMFSSMQSGDTGFLLTDNTGEITFLPNLGRWQWTRSGVVPQGGGITMRSVCWRGDVVLARIYSNPLTAGEVGNLWAQVEDMEPQHTIHISDILFFAYVEVKAGQHYRVAGHGFQTGDVLRLESMTDAEKTFTCQTTATANYVDAEIPSGFVTGKYRMLLRRGDATCPIGIVTLSLADNPVGWSFRRLLRIADYTRPMVRPRTRSHR